MDVLDAAYNLVHDYPGGAECLGPRIGKAPSTLAHEVNRAYQGAKLGLADAVRASVMAQDMRILNAFAVEMHALVIPLSPRGVSGDTATLAALGTMAREFSDVVAEASSAMADGHVSDNELRRVEQQASELVLAVQGMLGLLWQNNQAGKVGPAAPREPAVARAAGPQPLRAA